MEELTDEDLRKISTLEARAARFKTSQASRSARISCSSICRDEISDLGPLRGLVGLQSSVLANNKIADLTPLMI